MELVFDTIVSIFTRIFYAPRCAQTPTNFNNMEKYLKKVTKACIPCRTNKIHGEKITPTYAPVRATKIGEKISVDLFGPLPESVKRINHVFVAKDTYILESHMVIPHE